MWLWMLGAAFAQTGALQADVAAISALTDPEQALVEIAGRRVDAVDPSRQQALDAMRDAALSLIQDESSAGDAWPRIVELLADPESRERGQRFVEAAMLGVTPQSAPDSRTPVEGYEAERLSLRRVTFDYSELDAIVLVNRSRFELAVSTGRPSTFGRPQGWVHNRSYDAWVILDGTGGEVRRDELRQVVDDEVWGLLGYKQAPSTVPDRKLQTLVQTHNAVLAEAYGLSQAEADQVGGEPVMHWSDLASACPVEVAPRELLTVFDREYPLGRVCIGRTRVVPWYVPEGVREVQRELDGL